MPSAEQTSNSSSEQTPAQPQEDSEVKIALSPMVDDQKICNGQHLTKSLKNEFVVDSVEEEEGMGERDKMLLEQLRDDLQSRLRS